MWPEVVPFFRTVFANSEVEDQFFCSDCQGFWQAVEVDLFLLDGFPDRSMKTLSRQRPLPSGMKFWRGRWIRYSLIFSRLPMPRPIKRFTQK
jgi:hypothetical protein